MSFTVTSAVGTGAATAVGDEDSTHAWDDLITLQDEFVVPFTLTSVPDSAAPLDRLCSQISSFKKRARVYASRRFTSISAVRSDLTDALLFAKTRANAVTNGDLSDGAFDGPSNYLAETE
eukprot:c13174_g1_i2.p2 GENE.c13174_g1_i2~~c13174_g1_i2.p2  ORF type:complete len:120 (+),score=28.82 c13174_g1_i2:1-360(+)